MKRTVFPCYASRDRQLAEECAGLLDRDGGFEVLLKEGELRPGEDIISKAADALSADVMLIFLSPGTVPGPLELALWESAFLLEPKKAGVYAGFVLCSECPFPRIAARSMTAASSRTLPGQS